MNRSMSLAIVLLSCLSICAQNTTSVPPSNAVSMNHARDQPRHTPISSVRMADVKSLDSIVAALYDVISGPQSSPRNWERLKFLCIPEVRFIQNTRDGKGQIERTVMSFDDFKQAASDAFNKEPFYERGIHNQVDRFATIAQVFSTYASSHEKDGTPFERGINSMQFLYDGQRWWCVTILWDKEGPGNAIPPQYLK